MSFSRATRRSCVTPPGFFSVLAAFTILPMALTLPAFARQTPRQRVVSPRTPVTDTAPAAISVEDATRFLDQCTFGATQTDVAHVQTIGYSAFLDEQFAAPISNYNYLYTDHAAHGFLIRFIQNAVRKPDQLRQRIAFALSQVMVVNSKDAAFNGSDRANVMIPYQNALHKYGLGNYRDLMASMTKTAAMGTYLDMLNNAKANPTTNSRANENFSRELMQLFTLGVFQLNDDGTVKTDVGGHPLPTYSNAEVTEFARVFTGWTFGPRPGQVVTGLTDVPNYAAPMALWAPQHDTGAKTLFNGVTLPALAAGISTTTNNANLIAYGQNDLNVALDNIFAHPNLPPFVVTRLIQHLVTASPSPAYVGRVVQVFKNNGSGVRGDMKSVVKAILLDAEARDAVNARSTAGYGHWRSGVLYLTALLRQFEAQGDLYGIENWAADAGQDPMSPPNVFSFYHPDYRITAPDNLSYSAPEAMTFTTVTAIRRINFANDLIRDGKLGGAGIGVTTLVTSINIADYQNVALDTTTLINLVNQRLLHGEMSTAMRVEITNAVNAISATDTPANRLNRARTALFLTAASNEYQVER